MKGSLGELRNLDSVAERLTVAAAVDGERGWGKRHLG